MRRSIHVFSAILTIGLLSGCESSTTELDIDPQFAKGGNGVIASATGSGVRTGSIRHFQFSALAKADGTVNGQFNLTFEGRGNNHHHGDIICLRVEDNRAWVGTYITKSTVEGWIDTEGGFYVEDNGEGKGADDQLSLAWFAGGPGLAQAVCDGTQSLPDIGSIDQGNIQVR